MAVETTHTASAAGPAQGSSTAAPAAAPTPTADAALSFEDLVAQELGPEPPANANPEGKRSKPAAGKTAVADPDENDNDDDDGGDGDGIDPDDGDDFTDDDGDGNGDGAEDSAADAADGDAEGEDEPAEDEPDTDPDADLPEAHFKKLPKWAQKRIGKQAEALKSLRTEMAEKSFTITPTPESPLAHVETLEGLTQQVTLAKQIRKWCQANPEGGVIGDMELSAEDVAGRLAHAENVLEAAPDWQTRLTRRAEAKPWEAAKRVCPQMFEAGTEEHGFAANALQLCPEIRSKVPNWEMLLAAAVRGIRQVKEEDSGKYRYVRMEVRDGKVVPPSRPAGSTKPGTKPAPQAGARAGNSARPPVSPGGTPPPQKSVKGGKPDTAALAERYQKTKDQDDFAALVAAELG